MTRRLAAVVLFGAAGCPAAAVESPRAAGSWSLGPERLGTSPIRGLGIVDDDAVVVADGERLRSVRKGSIAWSTSLGAAAGPVALGGRLAVVAVAAAEGGQPLGLSAGVRGEPGAALIGLDSADGGWRWTLELGATRWVLVHHVSAGEHGFLVAGRFAGTLRAGAQIATSAGGEDGFVVAVDASGAVRWLRRIGGDGADAIAGAVELGGERVAIAGTFSGSAELGDAALTPLRADTAAADGFAAVLDRDGKVMWSRTWGGPLADTCAGVVRLGDDAIAVAGTVRGAVDVAGRQFSVRGNSDGMVAVFADDGAVRGAYLVGGDDFDAITDVAGGAGRLAIAGWFTGAIPTSSGTLRADGIDDAFLAVGSARQLDEIVAVASPGPAVISSLAAGAVGVAAAIDAAAPIRLGPSEHPVGASLWGRGW